MRGRNLSSLAVIIIFIAVSAYFSFSGNQTLAATLSEPCKISGEKWDYDANQNLPPFDCCAGLKACPDGYCCEVGNEERAITGQITGKASDQSTETTNPTINLDPEPLETVYTCYQNSDCGTNGWVGDPYCKNNDVYQKYRIYICNNAETINAECSHSDQEQKKEECGENIYKAWNNPYCKNGDVWQSRGFTEKGCLNGYCFTNTGTSERIVEACFECSGGECADGNNFNTPNGKIVTCYQNSDCGTNGWVGNPYCKNGDVYQKWRTYTCYSPGTGDSYCSYSDKGMKKQDCSEECSGGECSSTIIILGYTCYNDSDCGTNGWLNQDYCCSGGGENTDVCDTYRTYTCHNPGTPSAYCTDADEDMVKEDCGDSECGEWGDPYCSGGDVWHYRWCDTRGCGLGGEITCYTIGGTEEEKLEECGEAGCIDGQCNYTCYNNSDCGTDGWLGEEYCCPNAGENTDICDTYRTYTCNNPGTPSAYCTDTDEDMVKQDCGDSEFGNWSDPYCYDGDVWHGRSCRYRGCDSYGCYDGGGTEVEKLEECGEYGCVDGQCNYTCYNNSDCGTDGWLNQEYCTSGGGENTDVADTYRTYTCHNPGTPDAYCTHTDEDMVKQDCGDSEFGNWSDPYCYDGDVWHERECYARGCIGGGGGPHCYDHSYTDYEKLEECGDYGCIDGQCNYTCYNNSDCGTDGWLGDPYCKDGDVYQNWRTYTCNEAGTIDSYCSHTDEEKKEEECGDKVCINGECVSGDFPDLEISNLRLMWPPNPKAGEIISFEFIIKNIGEKRAENVGFRFDTGESSWDSPQPITLDVGGEIYVAYDHTYNNPRTYTATAIVDPDDQISESNENNNQMSITVVVS
ncbi:MAG: hypothetical protein KAU24_01775 [Candidatus Aenigmarchaeota archaeon]|nr:hypothetical protein [Candidatus Aenigmarchaeota archaeon]